MIKGLGLKVGPGICHEAADCGPLALVENGFVISIDVKKKVVNLEVQEDGLAAGRTCLQKSPATDEHDRQESTDA